MHWLSSNITVSQKNSAKHWKTPELAIALTAHLTCESHGCWLRAGACDGAPGRRRGRCAGLDLSPEFCEGLVLSVVERAEGYDNFLRVDMEGSVYTQRTVELVKRIRARNPAIGTVIQAYLYRSEGDIQDLLAYGCRVRLCKGAYKESAEVAFERKRDVDANFVRLMQMLLPSGFYHAIATHDPHMIGETIRWAAAKQISKDDFEFQMLYGIRTDLQRRLVKGGYRVRVYIPYGQDWFPYFMRRLAERPAIGSK